MAVKPISPNDVVKLKKNTIPDEVFEAFNELIARNFDGNSSTFRLSTVIELIVSKGRASKEIHSNHWLDVEPVYREEGWLVEYDGPGYNESYPATFTFKVKTKKVIDQSAG
jgi:hypothetical protein